MNTITAVPPQLLTSLSVLFTTSNAAVLAWRTPIAPGAFSLGQPSTACSLGPLPSRFCIQYCDRADGNWLHFDHVTAPVVVLTGLLPGGSYAVRIRSWTAAGWGAWLQTREPILTSSTKHTLPALQQAFSEVIEWANLCASSLSTNRSSSEPFKAIETILAPIIPLIALHDILEAVHEEAVAHAGFGPASAASDSGTSSHDAFSGPAERPLSSNSSMIGEGLASTRRTPVVSLPATTFSTTPPRRTFMTRMSSALGRASSSSSVIPSAAPAAKPPSMWDARLGRVFGWGAPATPARASTALVKSADTSSSVATVPQSSRSFRRVVFTGHSGPSRTSAGKMAPVGAGLLVWDRRHCQRCHLDLWGHGKAPPGDRARSDLLPSSSVSVSAEEVDSSDGGAAHICESCTSVLCITCRASVVITTARHPSELPTIPGLEEGGGEGGLCGVSTQRTCCECALAAASNIQRSRSDPCVRQVWPCPPIILSSESGHGLQVLDSGATMLLILGLVAVAEMSPSQQRRHYQHGILHNRNGWDSVAISTLLSRANQWILPVMTSRASLSKAVTTAPTGRVLLSSVLSQSDALCSEKRLACDAFVSANGSVVLPHPLAHAAAVLQAAMSSCDDIAACVQVTARLIACFPWLDLRKLFPLPSLSAQAAAGFAVCPGLEGLEIVRAALHSALLKQRIQADLKGSVYTSPISPPAAGVSVFEKLMSQAFKDLSREPGIVLITENGSDLREHTGMHPCDAGEMPWLVNSEKSVPSSDCIALSSSVSSRLYYPLSSSDRVTEFQQILSKLLRPCFSECIMAKDLRRFVSAISFSDSDSSSVSEFSDSFERYVRAPVEYSSHAKILLLKLLRYHASFVHAALPGLEACSLSKDAQAALAISQVLYACNVVLQALPSALEHTIDKATTLASNAVLLACSRTHNSGDAYSVVHSIFSQNSNCTEQPTVRDIFVELESASHASRPDAVGRVDESVVGLLPGVIPPRPGRLSPLVFLRPQQPQQWDRYSMQTRALSDECSAPITVHVIRNDAPHGTMATVLATSVDRYDLTDEPSAEASPCLTIQTTVIHDLRLQDPRLNSDRTTELRLDGAAPEEVSLDSLVTSLYDHNRLGPLLRSKLDCALAALNAAALTEPQSTDLFSDSLGGADLCHACFELEALQEVAREAMCRTLERKQSAWPVITDNSRRCGVQALERKPRKLSICFLGADALGGLALPFNTASVMGLLPPTCGGSPDDASATAELWAASASVSEPKHAASMLWRSMQSQHLVSAVPPATNASASWFVQKPGETGGPLKTAGWLNGLPTADLPLITPSAEGVESVESNCEPCRMATTKDGLKWIMNAALRLRLHERGLGTPALSAASSSTTLLHAAASGPFLLGAEASVGDFQLELPSIRLDESIREAPLRNDSVEQDAALENPDICPVRGINAADAVKQLAGLRSGWLTASFGFGVGTAASIGPSLRQIQRVTFGRKQTGIVRVRDHVKLRTRLERSDPVRSAARRGLRLDPRGVQRATSSERRAMLSETSKTAQKPGFEQSKVLPTGPAISNLGAARVLHDAGVASSWDSRRNKVLGNLGSVYIVASMVSMSDDALESSKQPLEVSTRSTATTSSLSLFQHHQSQGLATTNSYRMDPRPPDSDKAVAGAVDLQWDGSTNVCSLALWWAPPLHRSATRGVDVASSRDPPTAAALSTARHVCLGSGIVRVGSDASLAGTSARAVLVPLMKRIRVQVLLPRPTPSSWRDLLREGRLRPTVDAAARRLPEVTVQLTPAAPAPPVLPPLWHENAYACSHADACIMARRRIGSVVAEPDGGGAMLVAVPLSIVRAIEAERAALQATKSESPSAPTPRLLRARAATAVSIPQSRNMLGGPRVPPRTFTPPSSRLQELSTNHRKRRSIDAQTLNTSVKQPSLSSVVSTAAADNLNLPPSAAPTRTSSFDSAHLIPGVVCSTRSSFSPSSSSQSSRSSATSEDDDGGGNLPPLGVSRDAASSPDLVSLDLAETLGEAAPALPPHARPSEADHSVAAPSAAVSLPLTPPRKADAETGSPPAVSVTDLPSTAPSSREEKPLPADAAGAAAAATPSAGRRPTASASDYPNPPLSAAPDVIPWEEVLSFVSGFVWVTLSVPV